MKTYEKGLNTVQASCIYQVFTIYR